MSTVETNLYDPRSNGRDWTFLADSYRAQVLSSSTNEGFESHVNELLCELHPRRSFIFDPSFPGTFVDSDNGKIPGNLSRFARCSVRSPGIDVVFSCLVENILKNFYFKARPFIGHATRKVCRHWDVPTTHGRRKDMRLFVFAPLGASGGFIYEDATKRMVGNGFPSSLDCLGIAEMVPAVHRVENSKKR